MDFDSVYVLLIVVAAMSFLLQIEWLLLASIFLFFALIFSKYYAAFSTTSSAPAEIADLPAASGPAQQPIVVVTSGGGTAASITDNMIATMLGNVMAYDVFEKKDQANQYQFLSRGMKMRQNMFDHHGKVASSHQGFRRDYSGAAMDRLDKVLTKLEKKL
ncbi:MAG: hypothetical protein V1835_02235 [Candidatus Micrarchaeota archaeon]